MPRPPIDLDNDGELPFDVPVPLTDDQRAIKRNQRIAFRIILVIFGPMACLLMWEFSYASGEIANGLTGNVSCRYRNHFSESEETFIQTLPRARVVKVTDNCRYCIQRRDRYRANIVNIIGKRLCYIQVTTIAWSPDGKWQTMFDRGVSDTGDGILYVYNVAQGRMFRAGWSSENVAWSPDGKTLASNNEDGILIWHFGNDTIRRRWFRLVNPPENSWISAIMWTRNDEFALRTYMSDNPNSANLSTVAVQTNIFLMSLSGSLTEIVEMETTDLEDQQTLTYLSGESRLEFAAGSHEERRLCTVNLDGTDLTCEVTKEF